MGERFEVNHSIGSPAVVRVEDEVAVEVTSIESREWESIPWGAKWLFFLSFCIFVDTFVFITQFSSAPTISCQRSFSRVVERGSWRS